MTTALRWTWGTGALLLVLGLPPALGLYTLWPGVATTAAAAGITAARGRAVGPIWLALAWFVPSLPVLGSVGVYAWLAHQRLDPMLVVVLFVFGSAVAIATWVVFVVAMLVEAVRWRRRRFGEARPAWEDGPSQPT